MKLITKNILFLTSTFVLFAHPGHGLYNEGLAHQVTSGLHSAPIIIILAVAAVAIWGMKKLRQGNN